MKNLKQIQNLHIKAEELLDRADESNAIYEALLKYNLEVAAPNGFTPHSDVKINLQALDTKKIMNSYFLVVNEIKTFEI